MKNTGNNLIRIKDIAEKANVSVGTVDRVLYNRGGVKEETKQKVMRVLEEMDYQPNMLAKTLALKKTHKIVVLIPDSKNNAYWAKPLSGIRRAQQETAPFNTAIETLTFDLADEQSFAKQTEKILQTPPDGIVFNPVFKEASLSFVRQLDQLSIPYVFMDVNLKGAQNLSFFGQDALESGIVAGKLMHYGVPNKACIAIITITDKEDVARHIRNRAKGFIQYFKKKEIDTISFRETTINLSADNEPLNSLTTLFKENPDIKGVFVPNSRVFMVAQFLEKIKKNDLFLIGYDLIDQNIRFLKKEVIDFLISQKPEEQAYLSIKTLFDAILLHKKADKTNYSPIDIITKENLKYYSIR